MLFSERFASKKGYSITLRHASDRRPTGYINPVLVTTRLPKAFIEQAAKEVV
jgi:hypothetical protein